MTQPRRLPYQLLRRIHHEDGVREGVQRRDADRLLRRLVRGGAEGLRGEGELSLSLSLSFSRVLTLIFSHSLTLILTLVFSISFCLSRKHTQTYPMFSKPMTSTDLLEKEL